MKSKLLSRQSLLALSCLASFAAVPANAESTTFAQFVQVLPSDRPFEYTNLPGSPNVAELSAIGGDTVLITTIGTAVPSFSKISLSAFATGLPTETAGNITQFFSGSMTFTLDAPQLGLYGPSTHAFSVDFTGAEFTIQEGSEAPTLTADDHLGATINYFSDFADLSHLINKNFSISFSAASAPMVLDAGGRLPNATMSGSGTFAGAVPEPASWAMMLGGFALMGGLARRRSQSVAFA
jgi:hypothetical protein